MSNPTNPLVITLQEKPSAEYNAGTIWFRDQEVVGDVARAVSVGILQALKEGRAASHAATIIDKLDREKMRELGYDALVLVVQI